jgi:hypothetical protein
LKFQVLADQDGCTESQQIITSSRLKLSAQSEYVCRKQLTSKSHADKDGRTTDPTVEPPKHFENKLPLHLGGVNLCRSWVQNKKNHSQVDSDQLQAKIRDRLNSEKERFDSGSKNKTKSWNKGVHPWKLRVEG